LPSVLGNEVRSVMAGMEGANVFKSVMNDVLEYLELREYKVPEIDVRVMSDERLLDENRGYGCRLSGSTLEIYDFGDYRFNAVLMREAFNMLLPDSIKGLDESRDFGWEYALERLSKKEAKDWHDLWYRVSQPERLHGIRYHAPYSFPVFYRLKGEGFLRDLYSLFKSYEKYGIVLDKYGYFKVLEDYMSSHIYEFDEFEWRLINYLLENPTDSVERIAKVFGVKYNKVYRCFRRLKELSVIIPYRKVSLSKIGLVPMFLWVDGARLSDKVVKQLLKLPFLYSKFEYYDSRGGVVLTYAIPKNAKNISYYKQVVREVSLSSKYKIRSISPDSIFMSYNFRKYDPVVKRWFIAPDTWMGWCDRLFSSLNFEVVGYSGIEQISLRNIPLEQINSLDIEILNEIWNGVKGVRELARRLKKSPNDVLESIKKLRMMGILIDMWYVNFTGLNEMIFTYYVGSPDLCFISFAALNEFPSFIGYLNEVSKREAEVVAFINVPSGMQVKVAEAMHAIFSKYFDHFEAHFGKTSGGVYRFPKEFWDSEKRRWRAIEE